MTRERKMRRWHQGEDKLIGYLRALAIDKSVPDAIRLKAIDRLAQIDRIYKVVLTEASERMKIVPEEVVIEDTVDEGVDLMLEDLKNRGGETK